MTNNNIKKEIERVYGDSEIRKFLIMGVVMAFVMFFWKGIWYFAICEFFSVIFILLFIFKINKKKNSKKYIIDNKKNVENTMKTEEVSAQDIHDFRKKAVSGEDMELSKKTSFFLSLSMIIVAFLIWKYVHIAPGVFNVLSIMLAVFGSIMLYITIFVKKSTDLNPGEIKKRIESERKIWRFLNSKKK